MLAGIFFCALSLFGDVHLDELRGFRIEVPEGWRKVEQDRGPEGFVLRLLPPDSSGESGVSVRVVSLAAGEGVETLLARAEERVRQGGDAYSELEHQDGELAGRPAADLRVRFRAPSGEYRIAQSLIALDGRGYVVQRHAPLEEFEALEATLTAAAQTFALVEPSTETRDARRLAELVARCGSEVDWAANWSAAAARARDSGRPVLVAAFLVPGFALANTPRTTVFMDVDVIELVNERCVPFWYTPGSETPLVETYGLSSTSFGQALLLVTPDGEVVAETREATNSDLAYAFLRAGLARMPAFPGHPVPADLDTLERVERHVARGELERALELLDGQTSARAHRLRARVLRLQRRGAEALAAIAAARAAGGEPPEELLVEEATLMMRAGRDAEAARALERVVAAEPDAERATEARFLLGLLDLRARDRESATRRWQAVVEAHPESRSAWRAAAALGSPLIDVEVRPDLGWPDEAVVAEVLAFPRSSPLPPGRAPEAIEGALAWLLAAQRADGSWLSPTESATSPDLGPEPFVDAITALCGRALLRHRAARGAREAAGRALSFLVESIASRERTPPLVLFMDYVTWSDSMMLHFLAEAHAAGLAEASSIEAPARALVEDLAARQQETGGWSYYVTGDLKGAAAPAQSISFTTAAAVLALARARAVGLQVPDAVLEPAVEALGRMRSDEGLFAYFLFPGADPEPPPPAGAVGRGPACELALLRAGASSEERLAHAVERFLEHAPLFAAEQGKVLMHAGPQGQGCHYLFFDYAHTALALEALPPDPGARVRLLELVLDARQPDGSFLDTPILGRAYGTAMALIALRGR